MKSPHKEAVTYKFSDYEMQVGLLKQHFKPLEVNPVQYNQVVFSAIGKLIKRVMMHYGLRSKKYDNKGKNEAARRVKQALRNKGI